MKKLLAVMFAFSFLFVGFQAHAAVPDLIVSDFTWSPEAPHVSDNPVDHLDMNVTIKNIGDASITLPENMYVTLYKGSVGVGGFALGTHVYIINPGDSQVFDFRTAQSPNVLEQAGTFDLTVKVDGNSPTYSINSIENGLVNESNENNNTLTKKITIFGDSNSITIPTLKVSLDSTSDESQTIIAGAGTIAFAGIKITAGSQDVNNLNAIQIASDLSNSTKLNNLAIYDGPTKIGSTNYGLSYNGSYYQSWVYLNSKLSIPANTSKVLYIMADTSPVGSTSAFSGDVRLGVAGWTFDYPGAKVSPFGTAIYGNTIKIAYPTNASSITVLTPNGRDMYEVGQQINVTWDSTGISASSNNIDITLHGYNANGVIVWSKELSSFTLNDGQEKVILPTNLGGVPYGKNFVISVGTDSTNNPSPIFDYSDSTFTIGPATNVTNGGCSNGEVYSSTSGQACPVIVYDNGCYSGQVYSSTTGAKCPIINTPICPANMPNPLALCSDGRIEAATKDANNCTTSYRCIIPQNDLGCKNHEIYSSVTKQLCPTITIDSGCTGTSKYSSTTGQACLGNVPEVDGGCNGINKYSLMTGKLCGNFTGVYTPVIPNTIDVPITRTLKLGTKGDDVKALQAFLNLLADGSFGPKTQAKVMEWQAAHGLTPDGSFGSISRQKAGLSQ